MVRGFVGGGDDRMKGPNVSGVLVSDRQGLALAGMSHAQYTQTDRSDLM